MRGVIGRKVLSSYLLAVALAVVAHPVWAEALIEIAEARWTQRVDPVSRQPVSHLDAARAYTPLVLWMRIHAGEGALEKLATAGRLPIRHRWFRESFAGITAQGVSEMTDSIALDAGRQALIGALRYEVAARGYFDWRTWSAKAQPGPGRWYVNVVYADNTPVLCRDTAGQDKPCRFAITVR